MLLAIYRHGNIVEGFNSGLAFLKCQAFEKQHHFPLKAIHLPGMLACRVTLCPWFGFSKIEKLPAGRRGEKKQAIVLDQPKC